MNALPAPQTGTAPSAPAFKSRPLLAVYSLASREVVRFLRQRSRVFGALAQPALFWVLFGAGLGPSFQWSFADGKAVTYREYFFPGIVALVVLFTAIFAMISLIEDRREGFMQAVLVSPAPRWSVVLGKIMGGAILAWGQALLFLAAAPLVGIPLHWQMLPLLAVFVFVVAFALNALGFILAWQLDSTQGFHAVMTVFLMPMWLLSGAFFPAREGLLATVAACNPLSYAVAGIRRMMQGSDLPATLDYPALTWCWAVSLAFAAVTFTLALAVSHPRATLGRVS